MNRERRSADRVIVMRIAEIAAGCIRCTVPAKLPWLLLHETSSSSVKNSSTVGSYEYVEKSEAANASRAGVPMFETRKALIELSF